jgi:Fe-Mn family superoxide dismutase
MPMTRYALPDLPYDYAALEPHISGEIMQLHHDKHHRKYVDAANATLDKLEKARSTDEFETIAALERSLAFNVSGHVLHSIFWLNLAPRAGGEPIGPLAEQVRADFGSFESFKHQLTQAASTVMGSGWGALIWDPVLKRLTTAQFHDHQSETEQGAVPLMVIDAWEHAYYLQFRTDKDAYFKALWSLWNWEDVARRFERVRTLDLALEVTPAREEQAEAPVSLH